MLGISEWMSRGGSLTSSLGNSRSAEDGAAHPSPLPQPALYCFSWAVVIVAALIRLGLLAEGEVLFGGATRECSGRAAAFPRVPPPSLHHPGENPLGFCFLSETSDFSAQEQVGWVQQLCRAALRSGVGREQLRAGNSGRKGRVWSLEVGGFERSVQLAPLHRWHLCRQSWVVARGAVTRWGYMCLRPLEQGCLLAAEHGHGLAR